MGALYGSTLFICFNNAGTVQAMVSIERTVHYREKAAGMYSSIPYALAQVFIYIYPCRSFIMALNLLLGQDALCKVGMPIWELEG
jgi:hypothetical protein